MMNMPGQGLWDGIEDVPVFTRGTWFSPNFQGTVKIVRCRVQITRKKKIQFLAECEVLSSTSAQDPTGASRTWFQNQNENYLSALKSFAHAVLGVDDRSPEGAQKAAAVDRYLKAVMNYVAGAPNGFGGFVVNLTTTNTTKQDGGLFTRHDWSPYNWTAAGQPGPDLARFLQAAAPYANVMPQAQAAPQAPPQAQGGNQGWGSPPGFAGPPQGYGLPPGMAPPQPPAAAPQGWAPPSFGAPPAFGAPPPAAPPQAPAQGWSPPGQGPQGWGASPPPPAQGWGPPPQPQAPPPAPPPQVSQDGHWKLVNGEWVPNR
jgi:hypothetical protein